MTLFFLLNPRCKLNLLSVMNQGDSVRKKKKKEEEETIPQKVVASEPEIVATYTQELGEQIIKYEKLVDEIAAIRQQIEQEDFISEQKQALEAQELETLRRRIQLAHLIVQSQEEEELLLMMLLH